MVAPQHVTMEPRVNNNNNNNNNDLFKNVTRKFTRFFNPDEADRGNGAGRFAVLLWRITSAFILTIIQ